MAWVEARGGPIAMSNEGLTTIARRMASLGSRRSRKAREKAAADAAAHEAAPPAGAPSASEARPPEADPARAAIAAHLEFLGYQLTPGSDGWLFAEHPWRPNFYLKEFPIGWRLVALFTLGLLTPESSDLWLRSLNRWNEASLVSRFALTAGHGDGVALRVSALFPPDYERVRFGQLMEFWHRELELLKEGPELDAPEEDDVVTH
jgi:hypothetical protein